MKNLFLLGSLLCGLAANAEINLKKLAGSWKGECTQSQTIEKQGAVIEIYSFSLNGSITITKEWYADLSCKTLREKNTEEGSYKIGKENTNNGFNPSGTHEAEYVLKTGRELGLIWVSADYSKMRVARGFGTNQNTMLGIFQYSKQ